MVSILTHEVKQAPNICWVLSTHVDFDYMGVPTISDDNAMWRGGGNRPKELLSCRH